MVFVEVNGDWRRSELLQKELITLEDYKELVTAGKKIISKGLGATECLTAIHAKSQEAVHFRNIKEAVVAGFTKGSIQACLRGKNKSHKGFIWSEAA